MKHDGRDGGRRRLDAARGDVGMGIEEAGTRVCSSQALREAEGGIVNVNAVGVGHTWVLTSVYTRTNCRISMSLSFIFSIK